MSDEHSNPDTSYHKTASAVEAMEVVMTARINELECENKRLRELLVDTYEAISADPAGLFQKLIVTSMRDDMRELGIEVD